MTHPIDRAMPYFTYVDEVWAELDSLDFPPVDDPEFPHVRSGIDLRLWILDGFRNGSDAGVTADRIMAAAGL